ncbi:type I secretion C-terminal target domain-containing protein [Phreatobacter sp.]|uniref:type I secretion C-terminal target domain-containing protein n=1 Tax=Phreatobacter sp. TaxID=1966341 RepID=UPI0025EFB53F|nr:type I secretion C-terminal target domain-containing protein [Phreatobacter sp.]
MTFNLGTPAGAGAIRVESADLAALRVTSLPADSDVDVTLTLTPQSDGPFGTLTGIARPLAVTVDAVADSPVLTVAPAAGAEHTAIALTIGAAFGDTLDGSETHTIEIAGVPTGATLSAGRSLGGGTWSLTPAQLTGLTLTPPTGLTGTLDLVVTARAVETTTSGGEPNAANNTAVDVETLTVTVLARTEVPVVVTTPATVTEDFAMDAGGDKPLSVVLVPATDATTSWVIISGIADGVRFNAGTPAGPGAIRVESADLPGLRLIGLPLDSDVDLPLVVTPFSATPRGVITGTAQALTVVVDAVADHPFFDYSSLVTAIEDTPTPVGIIPRFHDATDGSEVHTLAIGSLPPGFTFSAGTRSGDLWIFSATDLIGLTFRAPTGFIGEVHPYIVGNSVETHFSGVEPFTGNNAVNWTWFFSIKVVVSPERPVLSVPVERHLSEDLAYMPGGAALDASMTPGATATSSWVIISGIPAGVVFSAGTPAGAGAIRVESADLATLRIVTLPLDSDADLRLTYTPFSSGPAGTYSGTAVTQNVWVDAVADRPTLSVEPASGFTDRPIALAITAGFGDTRDGSEERFFYIGGVPAGAKLSAGRDVGGGFWYLTTAEIAGLTITPPPGFAGEFTIRVEANSVESRFTGFEYRFGDNHERIEVPLTVTVAAPDLPSVVTSPATAPEDLVGAPGGVPLVATLTPGVPAASSWVVISGIPPGAGFNHGTAAGPGAIRVESADLPALRLTALPADSDADVTLTVTPFSSGPAGTLTGTAQTLVVAVDAVADLASLVVAPATGAEDSAIALGITAVFGDTRDGSETHTIEIAGVPAGALLSAGTFLGGGVWSLTPAQLAGLVMLPPPDFFGSIALTVTARAVESLTSGAEPVLTNNEAVVVRPMTVTVTPAPSIPLLDVTPVSVREDLGGAAPAGVPLAASLTPGEHAAASWVVISGIPAGVTFNVGAPVAAGAIRVESADLAALRLTGLPADSDADVSLTFTPFSAGPGGTFAGAARALVITVDAVADAVDVAVAPASGVDGRPIALEITATFGDVLDGSETHRITVSGLPPGATMSAGTNLGSGAWELTPAQLAGLSLTVPTGTTGTFPLRVAVEAEETRFSGFEPDRGNNRVVETATLPLTVTPFLEVPSLTTSPASVFEDLADAPVGGAPLTATLTPGLSATSSWVIVSGIPAGAAFNVGTPAGAGSIRVEAADLAALRLTALPADSDVDIVLTLTPFSTGPVGTFAGTAQLLPIGVDAVADMPVLDLVPATGLQDTPIALNIGAVFGDLVDGSESHSIAITVPPGVSLSAGTDLGGRWLLTPGQLSGLTLTPPPGFVGSIAISVEALALEARTSGDEPVAANNEARAVDTLVVEVVPRIEPPTITTAPATAAEDLVGAPVGGVPLVATLTPGTFAVSNWAIISGIPAGVTFNVGTPVGPEAIRVESADLPSLRLTGLPPDSDVDVTLTVTPVASGPSGDIAGASQALVITVDAVADTPTLAVGPSGGPEDTPIALDIAAVFGDEFDGSETHSITITGVPDGAGLTRGISLGGGAWSVLPIELVGLHLIPAPEFSGGITLGITAHAAETATSGGEPNPADNTATATASLVVSVAPVSDEPFAAVSDALAYEDLAGQPTGVPLTVAVVVAPGETGWVVISGIPAGVTFNVGIPAGPGAIRVDSGDLPALRLMSLPPDSDADVLLSVQPFAQDGAAPPTAGPPMPLTVIVDAVADAPALGLAPVVGAAGTPIALGIGATFGDTLDGSEEHTLIIDGLPAGMSLSAGVDLGGGRWLLQADQVPGVTLTPPIGTTGRLTLGVTAIAEETRPVDFETDILNNTASVSAPLTVTVLPADEAPAIATTPASAAEDLAGAAAGGVALSATLTPGASATSSWVIVSGIPAGVSFNVGTPAGAGSIRVESADLASLRLTGLPADSDADVTLTLTPFSAGPAGTVSGIAQPLMVTVDAVADTPTLSTTPASGAEDTAIALAITAGFGDTLDGSETHSVTITGVPSGALLSAGTDLGGGTWSLTPAQLAGLTLTPPPDFTGAITLGVAARAVETTTSGGEPDLANNEATASATLVVDVTPVSDVPSVAPLDAQAFEDLTGQPGGVPLVVNLVGPPGDRAWVVIAGVPAGVTLATAGGPLLPVGGTVTVDASDLPGLSLAGLPHDRDADFVLTVTPFAQPGTLAPIAGTAAALTITVDAVADAPILDVAPAAGTEDAPVALAISAVPRDVDGSEAITTISLGGVPVGAILAVGGVPLVPSAISGDFATYDLTPAQLAGLTFQGPPDVSGEVTLTVGATAAETPSDGESTLANNTAVQTATLVVTLAPVTDAPSVAPVDAIAFEDLAGQPAGVPLVIGLSLAPGEAGGIVVSGIPAGVTLSTTGGPVMPSGGSATVAAAEVASLRVSGLPANADADFVLTITPFAQDGAGPMVFGAARTLAVTVDAVADTPSLVALPASGVEDTPIALSISAALADLDGSETLGAVTLSGVPSGATLLSGTTVLAPLVPGLYEIEPGALSGLTLVPPAGFNGTITLGLAVAATETTTSGGEPVVANNIATATASLVVSVAPVSDVPTLAPIAAASGFEDLAGGPIAAPILVTAGAPGETAFVIISGIPAGVTLNAGTPTTLVPGGVLLTAGEAASLRIVGLPANSDVDFTLTATPVSVDGAATPTLGASRTLIVTIDAVADIPVLAARAAGAAEDTPVALTVSAAVADPSEILGAVRITGVPAGATLSAGTNLGGGIWEVAASALPGLTLTPPADFNGTIALGISVASTEVPSDVELTTANNVAGASASLVLSIAPVSDTPDLVVPALVQVKEDLGAGPIAITPPGPGPAAVPILVTPGAPGESAFVDVSGVPAGVVFNVAGTAVAPGVVRYTAAQAAALSITALPANSDRDFALTVTPLSIDGPAAPAFGAAKTITVAVDAVADVPTLSRADNTGNEDSFIPIRVTRALVDTDGSETLDAMRLTGVPSGAVLAFVGPGPSIVTLAPTSSSGGFDTYDLTGVQAASVRILPPHDFNGALVLGTTLTVRESATGGLEFQTGDNVASAVGSVTITVRPVSDVPGLALSTTAVDLREDLGVDRPGGPLVADGGRAIGMTVTPGAPGETAFVVLSGVPAGLSFNHAGVASALVPGGLRFTAAQALSLSITALPADSDGDVRLTVTPFSQDGTAAARPGTAATIALTIDAVVDTPTLGFTVAGAEDGLIPLALTTALGDTDGSEIITNATIGGLPAGYALVAVAGSTTTALTPTAGVYTIGAATIGQLRVIAPHDSHDTVTLSVSIDVREQALPPAGEIFVGDNTTTASGSIVLSVTPVSDPPTLVAPTLVVGKEDLGIAGPGAGDPGTTGGFATDGAPSGTLAIPIAVTPGAPDEVASVRIAGIPAGLGFNAGTIGADGTLTLTPAEAASLRITALPADRAGDIVLTVIGVSQDSGGVPPATVSQTLTVRLDATADVPSLAVAPIAVVEDAVVAGGTQRVALGIAAALGDVDGSEALSLEITGVPDGFALSAGSFDSSTGVWTVPQAAIAGLTLVAPHHAHGAFTLGVTAVAAEGAAGPSEPDPADNRATRFASLPVSIAPVADVPVLLVGGKAKGFEDSFIPLSVHAALVDADGSEALRVRLTDIPTGAVLRSGATTLVPVASGPGGDIYELAPGALTALAIRPPADSNVDFTIGVTAIASETSASSAAEASAAITVDVVGVADPGALVSGGSTPESAADVASGRVPLNLVAGIVDGDAAAGRTASESVTAIVIAGLPAGFALSRGLVTAIGPGGTTTWTLRKLAGGGSEWDAVDLIGWPAHRAATLDLRATVVTTENDGDTEATGFATFPVVVAPVVDDFAPGGGASGLEDTAIALTFAPGLVDADGSERIAGAVTLGQVPADAVLRADGVALTPSAIDGGLATYVVAPAALASLTLQARHDSNVDFTLSATMTIAEFDAGGAPIPGQSRTESFTLPVAVVGVADIPMPLAGDANGPAGTAIDLALGGTLADTDGSERLYVVVSGIPAGMGLRLAATASPGDHLLNLGGGRWLADAGALDDLQLRTRSDFGGGGTTVVPLTLTAIAQEDDGVRDRAAANLEFNVTITPAGGGGGGGGVNDATDLPGPTPTIAIAAGLGGDEDAGALLGVSLPGLPAGAAATLIVRRDSLPPGSELASGTPDGIFIDPATGDWIVVDEPGVLASLEIRPPANFAGMIEPDVAAIVTYADGRVGSAAAPVPIAIRPIADAAAIATGGAGAEDTLIKLDLAATPTDTDGSETISSLRISGLTPGAVLTDAAGVALPQTAGVYTIDDPSSVHVRPPEHLHGAVTYSVEATVVDSVAGLPVDTVVTTIAGSVAVAAVADAAPIDGPAVLSGIEHSGAALGGIGRVTVTPIDTDGSELLSVVVHVLTAPAGILPTDVRLSAGVDNGDGSWTLTRDEFAGASLLLPDNVAGDVAIRVVANSFELSNGSTAATQRDFAVAIQAAADAPLLTVAAASGPEDQPIGLAIDAGLVDLDGSETLTLTIENLPAGASLSAGTDNGDGSWSLTPAQLAGLSFTAPADEFGSYELTVVATATELGGGAPASASTTAALSVTVTDVVDSFVGGAGADTLTGTAGRDVIEGRGGADRLAGGAGDDRFVFGADALDAADVIEDFAAGDTLALDTLLQSLGGAPAEGGDYVRFVQSGINVELRVDQNGAGAGDTNTLLATIQDQTAAQVRAQTDFG